MGEQAIRFFSDAEKLGGLPAKVRLASLARITSAEAASAADDEALLAKLRAALGRLKRELDGTSRSGIYSPPPVPPVSDRDASEKLRTYLGAMLDLVSQRDLVFDDPDATCRRVTETASTVLDVARASVWMLHDASLVCRDLFQAKTHGHEAGLVLPEQGHEAYFTALRTERSILAGDARSDPRTSCFNESYFAPLGIVALLDVPIWVRGKMVGVICHEHVGRARAWDADEERFAALLSGFLSLALERPARKSTFPP